MVNDLTAHRESSESTCLYSFKYIIYFDHWKSFLVCGDEQENTLFDLKNSHRLNAVLPRESAQSWKTLWLVFSN